MSDLPKFSGSTGECIKCGSTGAYTQYVAENELSPPSRNRECLMRTCSECGFSWREAILAIPVAPKMIRRACVECGYQWQEAPLDA